mmetsp:Transcript_33352/g.59744  ORF Transcript_33352/g.59744 Transcript_33352/m.59744 type:complete len:268 (-) Transcript_33352:844-1647(-)
MSLPDFLDTLRTVNPPAAAKQPGPGIRRHGRCGRAGLPPSGLGAGRGWSGHRRVGPAHRVAPGPEGGTVVEQPPPEGRGDPEVGPGQDQAGGAGHEASPPPLSVRLITVDVVEEPFGVAAVVQAFGVVAVVQVLDPHSVDARYVPRVQDLGLVDHQQLRYPPGGLESWDHTCVKEVKVRENGAPKHDVGMERVHDGIEVEGGLHLDSPVSFAVYKQRRHGDGWSMGQQCLLEFSERSLNAAHIIVEEDVVHVGPRHPLGKLPQCVAA